MFVGTLSVNLLVNLLTGKGTIRSSKSTIRESQNF